MNIAIAKLQAHVRGSIQRRKFQVLGSYSHIHLMSVSHEWDTNYPYVYSLVRNEAYRGKVAHEILSSEKLYLESLQTLSQVFYSFIYSFDIYTYTL